MLLIEKAWEHTYPGIVLETGKLISHEVKHLRKKENWGTSVLKTEIPSGADEVEAEADADDDEDYVPSGAEPSWAKKLKRKMKKLFCMESHGQYMAHVSEKKARSRHKEVMPQFGAIFNSGLRARSLMRRSGFLSIVPGRIQRPSSLLPMMEVQATTRGYDDGDLRHCYHLRP